LEPGPNIHVSSSQSHTNSFQGLDRSNPFQHHHPFVSTVTHPFIITIQHQSREKEKREKSTAASPPASRTWNGLSSSDFNHGWGRDSGARGVDSRLSVVDARRRTRDV